PLGLAASESRPEAWMSGPAGSGWAAAASVSGAEARATSAAASGAGVSVSGAARSEVAATAAGPAVRPTAAAVGPAQWRRHRREQRGRTLPAGRRRPGGRDARSAAPRLRSCHPDVGPPQARAAVLLVRHGRVGDRLDAVN